MTVADGAEQISPVGEPLTEQEKLTMPVKPLEGVTVRVLVPLLVPLVGVVTAMVPLFDSARAGVATVTVTGVAAVMVPVGPAPVPVTVTV